MCIRDSYRPIVHYKRSVKQKCAKFIFGRGSAPSPFPISLEACGVLFSPPRSSGPVNTDIQSTSLWISDKNQIPAFKLKGYVRIKPRQYCCLCKRCADCFTVTWHREMSMNSLSYGRPGRITRPSVCLSREGSWFENKRHNKTKVGVNGERLLCEE